MAKRQNRIETWTTRTFTLASGEVAEQGKLAMLDTSTGKLVTSTEAAGLVCVGLFMDDITATADTPCRVKLKRPVTVVWMENSVANAVGATDILTTVYAEDDETVSTNSTDTSAAGIAWAIGSMGVAVELT